MQISWNGRQVLHGAIDGARSLGGWGMRPVVTSWMILLLETDGRDDLQKRSVRVQKKEQSRVQTEDKN